MDSSLRFLTATGDTGIQGQEGQNSAGFARGSLPIHLPVDQQWQNLWELTRPQVRTSVKDCLQFMKVSSSSGVNKSCSTDCSRDPPVYTSGGTGSRSPIAATTVAAISTRIQTQPTALPSLSGQLSVFHVLFFFFPPGKHQGPTVEFFRWLISIQEHRSSSKCLLWRISPVRGKSTRQQAPSLARRCSGPRNITSEKHYAVCNFHEALHSGYFHSKYIFLKNTIHTHTPPRKNTESQQN